MKKLFLLLAVCLMAGTTHVFGQAEKEYDKDNYLYATEVKAEAGNNVVIPLSLKNTENMIIKYNDEVQKNGGHGKKSQMRDAHKIKWTVNLDKKIENGEILMKLKKLMG